MAPDLAWLEEARVEALQQVGLAYSDLSARGLELPVVSLAIDYRAALLHGDQVELLSQVGRRAGLRLPWLSQFIAPMGPWRPKRGWSWCWWSSRQEAPSGA
jgi:acyl-CoA thioester hydrolase